MAWHQAGRVSATGATDATVDAGMPTLSTLSVILPGSTSPRVHPPAHLRRYYAKRCFLALIENLAKHMIVLKDSSFTEIMAFLNEAEKHGKDIRVVFNEGKHQSRTIASEARMLKKMFLKLRD